MKSKNAKLNSNQKLNFSFPQSTSAPICCYVSALWRSPSSVQTKPMNKNNISMTRPWLLYFSHRPDALIHTHPSPAWTSTDTSLYVYLVLVVLAMPFHNPHSQTPSIRLTLRAPPAFHSPPSVARISCRTATKLPQQLVGPHMSVSKLERKYKKM